MTNGTMLLTVLFILVLLSGIALLVLILNSSTSSNTPTIWEPDQTFTPSTIQNNKLGNFTFLGSYNTCCDGDFNGDPVKLNMLKKVLTMGIRYIDFEVFSVKGNTCVSVSTSNDDFTQKGAYNEIPLLNICETIRYNAFSNEVTNRSDPLFVQFRIKSRHRRVYNDLADAIKKHLQGYILGPKYAFNQKNLSNNIIHENINEFSGKIIIVIHEHSSESIIQGTSLFELTNILLTTSIYRSFDMETIYNNKQRAIDESKKEFRVVCPNGENTNNYDIRMPFKIGFHGILVNIHSSDGFLFKALDLYNPNSVKLKPKELQITDDVYKPDMSVSNRGDGNAVVDTLSVLDSDFTIRSE